MSEVMKTLTIDGTTYAVTDDTARTASGTVFSDGETLQEKFTNGDLGGADGIPIVTASSTDGVTYTATVDGMDSLVVGKEIIIIPNYTSTSVSPTLNVNGLGAKTLRCSVGSNNTTTVAPTSTSWLYSGKPVTVRYNGSFWVTDLIRADASALYGTVSISQGGTGATDAATALNNLGAAAAVHTHSDYAASSHTHAASEITSGVFGTARGGTGITSNPSMLTNLASTTAASVFATGPRPGVTGTLPLSNGGTGVTSLSALKTLLGAASIEIGTYTGARTETVSTVQQISVAFAPKFVWVGTLDSTTPWCFYQFYDTDDLKVIIGGEYSAYAFSGYPKIGGDYNALEVTTSGFAVCNYSYERETSTYYRSYETLLNLKSTTYFYLAIG